jgi:hypothetical protein
MIKKMGLDEYIRNLDNLNNDLCEDNLALVVIENFFDNSVASNIRNFAFNEFLLNANKDYQEFTENITADHARVDCEPKGANVQLISQNYFSFPWNDFSNNNNIRNTYQKLSKIRNSFDGVDFNENDLGYQYLDIRHYPVNGGYIAYHSDPPSLQKLVSMVSLSEKGIDFKNGGLFVYYKEKKLCIDDVVKPGDMYIFNPLHKHGIEPIDADQDGDIQWKNNSGRWVVFTPWAYPGVAST